MDSPPEVETGSVREVPGVDSANAGQGVCEEQSGEDVSYGNEVLLIARSLYFDTASSDPQQGLHAPENIDAILDITDALNEAGFELDPEYIRLEVTGHASPMWDSAQGNSRRAAEYNRALGQDRADMAAELVNTAFNEVAPIYGWPSLIEEVCVEEGNASGTTDIGSQGSNEGLRETGNQSDNSQQFRRATIRVLVASRSSTRRTESR